MDTHSPLRKCIKMLGEEENLKKNSIWPVGTSKTGQWGSRASRGPTGVTDSFKIENLCGNHMLWAFCILWQKNFFYSFLGLCFVKIDHFLTILGKRHIWSNQSNIFTKKVQKSNWNWILNLFCKNVWLIWPKIPFSQNCQKMTNFH